MPANATFCVRVGGFVCREPRAVWVEGLQGVRRACGCAEANEPAPIFLMQGQQSPKMMPSLPRRCACHAPRGPPTPAPPAVSRPPNAIRGADVHRKFLAFESGLCSSCSTRRHHSRRQQSPRRVGSAVPAPCSRRVKRWRGLRRSVGVLYCWRECWTQQSARRGRKRAEK